MRIQHNIMAMNAYRNYTTNTSALSKNLEKLSSGYKINRAGDDAAGLAISEKMRAQITGLETAQKNAKDGISLVQTAEGALTEVHDMLNRMVELANQSANGTYDNETDRANLQKEMDQLRSEIDRIADSSNFNGINLLDGSLAKTHGVEMGAVQDTSTPEVLSAAAGTAGTGSKVVDGVLTPGNDGTLYQTSIYLGDLTNTNATATGKVELSYNNADGSAKKITISIGAGKTLNAKELAAALNAGTSSVASGVTMSDSGASATASSGVAKGGSFSELYEASVSEDGNILTIRAKVQTGGEVGAAGGKLATGKIGTVGLANTSTSGVGTTDIKAAEESLREKYDGSNAATIKLFTKAGTDTANVDPSKAVYQVASTEYTISATGADLHNTGITVGKHTYVFNNKDNTDGLKGVPDNAIIIDVEATTTASDAATLLAAAITKAEGQNGNYTAADSNGVLTIRESTNYGQKVIDGDYKPGKGADLVKDAKFVLGGGASSTNTVTFDASKIGSGTTLTVNGKNYVFTNDNKKAVASNDIRISYTKDMTSDELAQAFVDAVKANDSSFDEDTISAAGAVVTFTNETSADGVEIEGVGRGLTLQIGDTSEPFNQLSVAVQDMHCSTLGINDATINISDQTSAADAVDAIKTAINTVSSVRGTLGATQNRLDHTINNLAVMTENIQDAESTIRDTDVAKEMMSYTKNNILVQSAQAMLAQANQVPQGVLQLLG